MKALLNYEGFVKEMQIEKALPEIIVNLRIYLGDKATEKGIFKLIKVSDVGTNYMGRWKFEKIAYYEFKE